VSPGRGCGVWSASGCGEVLRLRASEAADSPRRIRRRRWRERENGTTGPTRPSTISRGAQSAGEQEQLARRMRARLAGWSAGAMENAGDVVGVGHNVEDPHAAAALAADGDVDGEHAGEEAGPADAARSGGGLGGGWRVVVVEAQGELLAGGGDDGRREDAGAEVMRSRLGCDHQAPTCNRDSPGRGRPMSRPCFPPRGAEDPPERVGVPAPTSRRVSLGGENRANRSRFAATRSPAPYVVMQSRAARRPGLRPSAVAPETPRSSNTPTSSTLRADAQRSRVARCASGPG
jgi:hypothetical protein